MKKIFAIIAFVLCIAITSSAYAKEDIDINTYPCKQFMASAEEMPLVIFWIDGYLSAISDQAVLNQEWMQSLTKQITAFCTANPNKSLMEAIESVE